jgi:HEPN domain-containing protein
MTAPRVPAELLDPVVAYFRPQRVILFGSTARGEAGPDSDIDLLVVVDDDAPAEKLTLKAGFEAHRFYTKAADVFPMSAAAFERNRTIIGTLAAEAAADGIVVYGPPMEPPSMRTPDPNARWAAVERWLAVAERDRRTALACLADEPPLRESAAFHCQQAVEKLLKGFLVLAPKRSRKTHSLAELGAMAEASFPDIAEFVAAAKGWSNWAVVYRYPGEDGADVPPEPDEDELRRALAVLDALAARLRAARPKAD